MGERDIEMIVLGGSAGALDVLATIVHALPADFAFPIAVVLHLPPAKPS
jgi:two-component system chemotaxis response regulator CheB